MPQGLSCEVRRCCCEGLEGACSKKPLLKIKKPFQLATLPPAHQLFIFKQTKLSQPKKTSNASFVVLILLGSSVRGIRKDTQSFEHVKGILQSSFMHQKHPIPLDKGSSDLCEISVV